MKNTILAGLVAATLAAFSMAPHAQAQDAAPTTCKDGSTSQKSGRGACSGHGGVQKSSDSTAPNPAGSSTASAPASGSVDATTCKDGTTSQKSGRGACSGHGGVQKSDGSMSSSSTPSTASSTAPNNPGSSTASAPASGSVDQTTCKDGTTSQSSGRGACSGHGGVQKDKSSTAGTSMSTPGSSTPAATSAPVPASGAPTSTTSSSAAKNSTATRSAPTEAASNTDPTGATAKCKDGTYSKSTHHSGTCSHHGGVAEWLTGASN